MFTDIAKISSYETRRVPRSVYLKSSKLQLTFSKDTGLLTQMMNRNTGVCLIHFLTMSHRAVVFRALLSLNICFSLNGTWVWNIRFVCLDISLQELIEAVDWAGTNSYGAILLLV